MWTTWMKPKNKNMSVSLLPSTSQSSQNTLTYHSDNFHISEPVYIVQSGERPHKTIQKFLINFHDATSKICTSASLNCLCITLPDTTGNMGPFTSQPTNLPLNSLERIEEFHLQRKLRPLPGPKAIQWPHAASLLSLHVLLDSEIEVCFWVSHPFFLYRWTRGSSRQYHRDLQEAEQRWFKI